MGFSSISIVGYDSEAIGVGDIVVGIVHSSLAPRLHCGWRKVMKVGNKGAWHHEASFFLTN